MIDRFVQAFDANREALRAEWTAQAPNNYNSIVKRVVELFVNEEDYGRSPDPERITVINHGDYQGTLLFIIGANGYQPSNYWYVRVHYGSCSECDTFTAIRGYRWDDGPTPAEEVEGYMTLALHIVQAIKPMQDEGSY